MERHDYTILVRHGNCETLAHVAAESEEKARKIAWEWAQQQQEPRNPVCTVVTNFVRLTQIAQPEVPWRIVYD